MTQARLEVPEEIVPNRIRTYTRASSRPERSQLMPGARAPRVAKTRGIVDLEANQAALDFLLFTATAAEITSEGHYVNPKGCCRGLAGAPPPSEILLEKPGVRYRDGR